MLYVTCPICGGSVYIEDIPDRMPVSIPSHPIGETLPTCIGSGRKSSAVWMVRPQSTPAITVS